MHIAATARSRDNRFSALGAPHRIWAISAIHGDIERLVQVHDEIYYHIQPGDRLVYHGNYSGFGAEGAACIDEILTFRRLVLATPGMHCNDIVYLRGQQEEIWQQLLQLQFMPDPLASLLWMLNHGLSNTLNSYGLSPHEGIEACRHGVMGLTKWTNRVRETIRQRPGHALFHTQLLRAAYTSDQGLYPMLFVHAGLDANRPLQDQNETFCWGSDAFEGMQSAYLPFQKVIRGFDPEHKGVIMNCITATIDGGCGFGGDLVCAGFAQDGQNLGLIQA
jgi:hypothetical protein